MATNKLVNFGHGLAANVPTTADFIGGIYFASDNGRIGVCTAADTFEWYGGNVKNASMVNSILNIELNTGSTITLDFTDVASAEATMTVFTKLQTAIDTKVDKVNGKGLSTNDFTTAEKNKLTAIEAGAEVNIIETISVNGTALPVTSKGVNVLIPAATVTGVSATDPLLSLVNKQVTSEIGISYQSTTKTIVLSGKGGTEIGTIDCNEFIKDGMIDNVEFNSTTKILTLTFNTASGKDPIEIDMTALVDTYTAGNGVSITSNKISLKLDATAGSENFLTLGANGLRLSGVQDAINTAKSNVDNYTINGIKISTNPTLTGANTKLSAGYLQSTTYVAPKIGDSLDVAIGSLTKGIADAKISGVTTFGGQAGDITLKAGQTDNGSVNLTLVGKELNGAVVGLKSAAFTDSDDYATKAQGTKADTAIQTTSGSGYLSLTKSGTAINGSLSVQAIATASTTAKGLVEASDVKQYVDAKAEAATLYWYSF